MLFFNLSSLLVSLMASTRTNSFREQVISPTSTICADDMADDPSKSRLNDPEKSATSLASQKQLSPLRKGLVLAVLSGAQFFDIYNSCAVIIALPTASISLMNFLLPMLNFSMLPARRGFGILSGSSSMGFVSVYTHLCCLYAHLWPFI